MALVGYARVGSVGQRLDVQLDKLKHCDTIVQDKKRGASARRPSLRACLASLREGNTLVVTHLDRLARSTLHLCQIADGLERQHVGLQVLDQQIDTREATGRLLFPLLGAIAPFETRIRAERQMDGILQAKARGVRFGRKKTLTPAQVTELRQRRAHGDLMTTLMQDYRLSKVSVYRYLAPDDVSLGGTRHPETRRQAHAPRAGKIPAARPREAAKWRGEGHSSMAVSSWCRRGG